MYAQSDSIGSIFFAEEAESGQIDIMYDFEHAVAGFQFDIGGLSGLSASGGAAEDAGFQVSAGSSTVIGFSFSGATIAAGTGLLTTISYDSILNDTVTLTLGSGAITAPGGIDLAADVNA